MEQGTPRSDAPELTRVLTGSRPGQSRQRLAPGAIVYAQGGAADAVFYLESGRVKMSVVAANGKEVLFALRGPGEIFGMRSLIAQRRSATAITLTECSLVRITPSSLNRMLHEEPGFAELLVTHLVRQHLRDQGTIIDQLTNPSEKRLARVLLQLGDRPGGDASQSISIPVNQADLASMIGTTRSRVSFFMNKFRRNGFIEYDRQGHLDVRDSLREVLRDC